MIQQYGEFATLAVDGWTVTFGTKKAITSPDRTGSKVYYQSGNV